MTLRVKKINFKLRRGSATKMFLDMGFRENFFQSKGFLVEKKVEKHCSTIIISFEGLIRVRI